MSSVKPPTQGRHPSKLSEAFSAIRSGLWGAGLFSLVINLLMLTGPLFMLQVYDRVLSSRSVPTLVALFVLVAALFGFLGIFDFVRARVFSRMGHRLDHMLMVPAMKSWIFQGIIGNNETSRPVNDLTGLRLFMGSPGLPALFDLPWTPLYIAIVFFLHPWLGWLTIGGALLVLILAIANEGFTKNPLREAMGYDLAEAQLSEQSQRNAQAIIAMGMTGNIVKHWQGIRKSGAGLAQSGGDIGQGISSSSKAIRMLLQSAILALGGYLAIQQEISPGTIIAASIIAGRGLSPIDMTIGNWRNIIRAREAYRRLNAVLSQTSSPAASIELPAPSGNLDVANISKFAPSPTMGASQDGRPILQGLNFTLAPGDGLGVIGPSAAGKTCLARLLVGLWLPDQGSVRLDGATFDQWDSDKLGRHIGYLPQSVELITGSVSQNISRFDPDVEDEVVIEAAKLAGVHDLILSLPDGYATMIGHGKTPLSGGQAQRIALARAVLRKPALVVLDEPNSNLDAFGDEALTKAIENLREAGSMVVVMAHRPSAIAAVNYILMLQEGRQAEFGPKAEVLRKVTKVAAIA